MDSYNYVVQRPGNFDGLPDPDKASPLRIKTKIPPPKEPEGGGGINAITPQSTVKVVNSNSNVDSATLNCLAQLNNVHAEVGKANTEISELKALVNNFRLIFDLLTNKSFIFSTSIALTTWEVKHEKKSMSLVYFLVDSNGFELFPDEVQIVDGDHLKIKFTVPQSGSVNLLFF